MFGLSADGGVLRTEFHIRSPLGCTLRYPPHVSTTFHNKVIGLRPTRLSRDGFAHGSDSKR